MSTDMAEPIEAQVVEERSVASLAPAVIGHTSALVVPAAGDAEIVEAFHRYQSLRTKLLVPADFQHIQGKEFPKKSAWRKLAVAFGVTFEIRDRVYERDGNRRIERAEFVVRAVAPNGRYVDGFGACDLYEKCCIPGCRKGGQHKHCAAKDGTCPGSVHFSNSQHDVPATASTRAMNRAASDMFGFGAVSAEEILGLDDGWWGGWETEEEMKETTEPVFAWLKVAPADIRDRAKAWYADRELDSKKAMTYGDFTDFAAFVAQLRADTVVAPAPPCALCDHPEDKHHPDQTGARICEECPECPGYRPPA